MAYDPDEFSTKAEEVAKLDKLLSQLMDCDLSGWDSDFVDDLADRISKYKDRTHITPLQWEQIERMKRQYGFD